MGHTLTQPSISNYRFWYKKSHKRSSVKNVMYYFTTNIFLLWECFLLSTGWINGKLFLDVLNGILSIVLFGQLVNDCAHTWNSRLPHIFSLDLQNSLYLIKSFLFQKIIFFMEHKLCAFGLKMGELLFIH